MFNPMLFAADWWQSAFKAWELSVAVPRVVLHRSERLLNAGYMPNPRDHKEFALMGQEKVEAFQESWNAIFVEWTTLGWKISSAAFQQWMRFAPFSPQQLAKSQSTFLQAAAKNNKALSSSLSRVVEKGLHPVHRRATANAKRLGRVKKR